RMNREAKARDSLLTVEVIELYHGGQYSAYTFRRYNDLRLVFAPHLTLGAFGGEPDNFTYPRYSLDYSFFRAYGPDGEPLRPEHYFEWSTDGAQEGEPVFVIGNPGTTSRLSTVAQLEFERDYTLPHSIDILRSRIDILQSFIEEHPEDARKFELRNTLHQLSNQLKKHEGELGGLRDSTLIARRERAEFELQQQIAAVDSLRSAFGDVIRDIRILQGTKEGVAGQSAAFGFFASPAVDSHVLVRAVYGYLISLMSQRGVSAADIADTREAALAIEDWPAELEVAYLAARLHDMQRNLGRTDPTVSRLLQGRTPEQAAQQIVSNTALTDSAAYAELLESGFLRSGDPSVALAEAITPLYFTIQQQVSGIESREQELNAALARARFALFGTDIPPDATFSLRIADGVVAGYPYNGTVAPAHTTFLGMYDHYYSYHTDSDEWDLPGDLQSPPEDLDLSVQVNLVSTNDITGGDRKSTRLNSSH